MRLSLAYLAYTRPWVLSPVKIGCTYNLSTWEIEGQLSLMIAGVGTLEGREQAGRLERVETDQSEGM